MRQVKIYHDEGQTVMPEPEFMDILIENGEVAVDGKTYSDVNRVKFSDQ